MFLSSGSNEHFIDVRALVTEANDTELHYYHLPLRKMISEVVMPFIACVTSYLPRQEVLFIRYQFQLRIFNDKNILNGVWYLDCENPHLTFKIIYVVLVALHLQFHRVNAVQVSQMRTYYSFHFEEKMYVECSRIPLQFSWYHQSMGMIRDKIVIRCILHTMSRKFALLLKTFSIKVVVLRSDWNN